MQIQISWLLKKPTDLDLHCLQNRVYPGSAGQGLNNVEKDIKHLVIIMSGLFDKQLFANYRGV